MAVRRSGQPTVHNGVSPRHTRATAMPVRDDDVDLR